MLVQFKVSNNYGRVLAQVKAENLSMFLGQLSNDLKQVGAHEGKASKDGYIRETGREVFGSLSGRFDDQQE